MKNFKWGYEYNKIFINKKIKFVINSVPFA